MIDDKVAQENALLISLAAGKTGIIDDLEKRGYDGLEAVQKEWGILSKISKLTSMR